ncbi:PREDICTED: G/T mismatch-specific thymine DNA glycosylase isoform X1 [Nanorana parkeri]|uniref:G/T mismatch-specific thymine DNA glycosylase isoform X1 n=2 Tax=Nanorana parkeri TaxID=125878 RepID=UPI0008546E36|nr:PREDICTED: G/T mismatch-specific thymine DNA glycosylase isoform X1 [Nanorana parkeri]
MEAQDPGSYYAFQQAQSFYGYQYHQMMNAPSNIELGNEQRTLHTLTGVPQHELQAFSGMLGNEHQMHHGMNGIPGPEPMKMQATEAPEFPQEPTQEGATKGKRKRGKAPAEPKPKKKETAKSAKTPKSGKQEKITDTFKVKRKVDRFNGVSEAELLTKTLPDILTFNLDIVIIGINPGLMAAHKGHHYPGPGNHFWKCLFLSGLSDKLLNHLDDLALPEEYGIGFTNMVERTTPGSKDLSSKEFREGGRILLQKLQKYKPRIAAFNGKCIYEIFSKEIFGVKIKKFEFGIQPHRVPDTDTICYVMPSSSARCAQFPRAQDKVHHYIKLKELRNHLKGVEVTREVQEVQYTFDLQLAQQDAKKQAVKEEKYDPGYDAASGGNLNEQMPNGDSGSCNLPNPEAPCNSESVQNGPWPSEPHGEHMSTLNHCEDQRQESSSA